MKSAPLPLSAFAPNLRRAFEAAQQFGKFAFELRSEKELYAIKMRMYRYRQSLNAYHTAKDAEFNAYVQSTEISYSLVPPVIEIRAKEVVSGTEALDEALDLLYSTGESGVTSDEDLKNDAYMKLLRKQVKEQNGKDS
jgi:hypothetical protein